MFQKIMEYAGPYKKGTYASVAVMLVSVLMGILPFILVYQLIIPLLNSGVMDTGYVTVRIVGVLICLVMQAILYGWGLSLSHQTAYNTLMNLRIALQKRMENLPLGVVEDKGNGAVKKMFVDDVESLEVLLAHTIPEGISNLIIPIVVYIAMFFVDWKLAFMSLASIPPGVLAMKIMYSTGARRMGPYFEASQTMNNTIIEYVNGMEVVKVFNRDDESYENFSKDIKKYRDYTLDWYKTCWPWMAVYSTILPCIIILTLPLGSFFVLKQISSLPDLILVLCLSLSIGLPLLKALGFLPALPQLNYKISALEQVFGAEPLKQADKGFSGKDYSISYENVSFGYGEKNVVENISFSSKEGCKTALVGESGSGKSTLAKLLVHYYDVGAGKITIGGQEICDMSLEALNELISYVAQEQFLFNTSIMENIRIGKPGATNQEVIEAAVKAQCMEFVKKLPDGIHTSAGDAGKQLSGGQRQRVSLARAILKNSPIIVLDEATAFTDPENEEKLEAAISELIKGKTLLVIAHKLPSVMNADQILVMEHGRLAASGKHEALLKSCEEYRKLWNAGQISTKWKAEDAMEGDAL